MVFDEVSSYYAAENLGSDVVPLEPFSNGIVSRENGSSSMLSAAPVQQDQAEIRRSTREMRQPEYLHDFQVHVNYDSVTSCFLLGITCDDNAPRSYKEAQGVAKWEASMHEEIKALHQNDTWELVPKLNEAELIT